MTQGVVPPSALAAEPGSEYVLQMARVDLMIRKHQFVEAAEELGRVPKGHHSDPLFQRYLGKVLAGLYSPPSRTSSGGPGLEARNRTIQQLRVTRRRQDSDARSDQSFDHDGLQVNEHLETDLKTKDSIRARLVLDLDGFKDGHNDLRYRTLLADLYKDSSHLALGDSATYTAPYFLRGSRLRGVDLLLSGERHEFQALVGAYPHWLEDRDQYIYPRSVVGVRDRWQFLEDRLRFGANFVKTRDTEKIRTIDVANQPRDNTVFSLDQEMKLIPDVWFLKASEAYSTTDDNLLQDRFGDNRKLKDSSLTVESLLIRPWAQWTSRFQRTGPDFRLLGDISSGSVVNSKGFTADRQIIDQLLDLSPMGPFDLDLEASWNRNNLDDDDTIAEIRQGWYTANLGVLVPEGWPRPRFRGTLTDTVSTPGSTTRPIHSRAVSLRSELAHYAEGIHFTEFLEYQGEFPVKDQKSFSPEENWALGTRFAATLLERVLVSPYYTYRLTDEDFDEARVRGTQHEAGISSSIPLWSTASLGLGYTFLHRQLADPNGTRLTPNEGHTGTASITWPYTHYSWNKRRKVSVFPSVTAYLTDLKNKLEKRPSISSRMTLGYELFQQWKAELMGEFLFDRDPDGDRIRTEESRIWMLWTSQWQ